MSRLDASKLKSHPDSGVTIGTTLLDDGYGENRKAKSLTQDVPNGKAKGTSLFARALRNIEIGYMKHKNHRYCVGNVKSIHICFLN